MAELITLTTKTRGRNSRDVEYQGLGRIERKEVEGKDGKKEVEESVVTDGVVTKVEDMLPLPGIDGNLQRLLDMAVIGYNKFQRDAALDIDEFAAFIQPDWDEKRTDAFKRSVRALAKVAEIEVDEAATLVLSKMQKSEKPAEASA